MTRTLSVLADFGKRGLVAALAASFLVAPVAPSTAHAGAEPVLEARIPADAVNYTVRRLLVTRGSVVKRLDEIVFSPITGSITVGGQIEIPPGLIHSLEQRTGGEEVPQLHDFQFTFTPKVLNLAKNSYLKVTLNSLTLNGQEFSNSFPVFSNFIKILLSYTNLKNLLAARSSGETGETIPADVTLPAQVDRLLKTKSIRFTAASNSLTIRLNLSELINLGAYQSMVARLRLWHFGPMREHPTQDAQIYIAIGEGKPIPYWERTLEQRKQREAAQLRDRARQRIEQCCAPNKIREELENHYFEQRRAFGLLLLSPREMREMESTLEHIKSSIGRTLTLDNPEFAADPEGYTERFKRAIQTRIRSHMEEVRRRHEIVTDIRGGGRTQYPAGNAHPFIVKRLSQRALSGIVRYFRDIKARGENLFQDLDVFLAPQLPGLILRGAIRVDLNSLLALSNARQPLRLNSDMYGDGIPFELSARFYMEDNGWLRLDVDSVTLFRGAEALVFDRARPNGQFLINAAQAFMDQSLVGTVLNADNFLNNDQVAEADERQIREAKSKLQRLPRRYQEVVQGGADDDIELLKKLVSTDIQNDPFIASVQEYIENKVQLVLDRILVYDRARKSFRFALNPHVISSVLGMRSESQVWNTEAVYDKNRGKAYLEVSVGNGPRTRAYVDELYNRLEYYDSQEYTGDSVDDRDSTDFSITLGTAAVTQFINEQLGHLERQQRAAANREMGEAKEQTHVIAKNFRMSVAGAHQLKLDMGVELIEKIKRGWYNPAGWFGDTWITERNDANVTLTVEMRTGSLESFRNKIARADRSLFLGDEVLVLDVVQAGVDTSKYSFLQKVVGLVLDVRDVDFRGGRLARWLKKFALKKVIPMLDNAADEGNTMLGTFALNRLVKFHLHESEILLQINPRLYSSAFEVSLIPQRFGPARGKSLHIDQTKGSITLDFTVNSSLAGYDRDELLRVIDRSKTLYAPYLRERSGQKLFELLSTNQLWDRTFYNSDISKKSVFHRFMDVMRRYPDLIDLSGKDAAAIRATPSSRIGTETGFELMYFASAAYAQWEPLDQLIRKIQGNDLEERLTAGHYYRDMVSRRDLLKSAYIDPFMEAYRQKYQGKNQIILRRGTTDWNYKFYSDAAFATTTYERLLRALSR